MFRRHWQKIGWAAFIFFLLKGLIWLAIFFGAAAWWSR
jgi:hypothetical protein